MSLGEARRLTKRTVQTATNLFIGLKHEYFAQFLELLIFNFLLLAFQFIYLFLRYRYLNESIPVWYSMPWGDLQLDYKRNILWIPIVSTGLVFTGISLIFLMRNLYARYLFQVITLVFTFANTALTYSLVRIMLIASSPFDFFISSRYVELIPPFIAAFAVVLVITPKFIQFAKDQGLVTNPGLHQHPAMILSKPSARGGGVVFTLGVILTAALFVPLTPKILGMILIAIMLSLLGLADDHQNTHPRSRFKSLENPAIRLILLFLIISLTLYFDIVIKFVGNPLGGTFDLSSLSFLPSIVTVLWIVWILNLLSWSNGVDGQYSGIIGISSLVIAFLSLRFIPLTTEHLAYSKVAVIAAGSAFGLVRYTWHPSKIMWGFSAMSAGVVLASLSILINAKTATSIIMILIPFLDAIVTIFRRMLQGKNPLKGDRGHLHHLLMERGWGIQKIATFYWITTAIFGIVGFVSSEKYAALVTLSLGGVVAFFIVLMNLKTFLKKPGSLISE
jgi:UDP-GlcNAc:undecaprenyl-phosphate GlcNAc-1-phosphate transferase